MSKTWTPGIAVVPLGTSCSAARLASCPADTSRNSPAGPLALGAPYKRRGDTLLETMPAASARIARLVERGDVTVASDGLTGPRTDGAATGAALYHAPFARAAGDSGTTEVVELAIKRNVLWDLKTLPAATADGSPSIGWDDKGQRVECKRRALGFVSFLPHIFDICPGLGFHAFSCEPEDGQAFEPHILCEAPIDIRYATLGESAHRRIQATVRTTMTYIFPDVDPTKLTLDTSSLKPTSGAASLWFTLDVDYDANSVTFEKLQELIPLWVSSTRAQGIDGRSYDLSTFRIFIFPKQ